jgi:hypothetical protein
LSYTSIPKGTDPWDVQVNAAFADQDLRISTNTTDIATSAANISTNSGQISSLQAQVTTNLDNLVYKVDNHGAVGDGTTNDQPAIQALINSVPRGATVKFGAKRYAISDTLTLPPYVRVEGAFYDRDAAQADGYPAIVPLAGFVGASVFTLVDKATGGYATENRDAMITNLVIDGVNLTTETVSGISATGFVHSTQIFQVTITGMTNHFITQASNGSGNPYSWRMSDIQLLGTGSGTAWNGFNLIGTDHQLTSCRTLNIRGNGYQLNGGANNQIDNCRAEWSALSGLYITGSWGTGTGSGGCIVNGFSTDRNSSYGVLVDSTGNASHLISGLMARRDGRNGFPGTGGGGFAGLRVSSATTPVIVSGITVYPGVNDDGTGVNSPERGISVANSTYVSIENGYLHADTTPWHDGAGNTALYRGPLVGTATGTTAAPTRSLVGANSMPGPFNLTQGGYTATRGASGNTLLNGNVTGDTQQRLAVTANGDMTWGSGAGAGDVVLKRSGAGVLQVTTGTLDLNSKKITGLANGTAATDAVAFNQITIARTVTSNETNSTTTQQASTQLILPVVATGTYLMRAELVWNTPNAVNFVHSWTGPAGATLTWTDSTATSMATIGATDTWSSTGVDKAAYFFGTLATTGTAGNFTLTFASGTAANTATLKINSNVTLYRIS